MTEGIAAPSQVRARVSRSAPEAHACKLTLTDHTRTKAAMRRKGAPTPVPPVAVTEGIAAPSQVRLRGTEYARSAYRYTRACMSHAHTDSEAAHGYYITTTTTNKLLRLPPLY